MEESRWSVNSACPPTTGQTLDSGRAVIMVNSTPSFSMLGPPSLAAGMNETEWSCLFHVWLAPGLGPGRQHYFMNTGASWP